MVNGSSVLLVLVGTLLGATGTFLIYRGATRSLWQLWKNKEALGGFFLYALSTIFYIAALRQEHLSVIYPFVSTSYVWATILAVRFLGETVNRWKILSLSGIILGVILIGIGS